MKSDHVFKELSGSDEVSSESWSIGDGLDDELSEAYLGGEAAKNSRNTITRSRDDDDDVDVVVETPQVAETREENPHYRWEQGCQNSKIDYSLAVNDRLANADEFRDDLHASRDDKIQGLSSSNHEESTFGVEWLPDSFDSQKIQKIEGHSLNETSRPLKMRSPAKENGSWANNIPRPTKVATNVMGDCSSNKEETDGNAGSIGPIDHQPRKEKAIKGSSFQKTQEKEKDTAVLIDLHTAEQEVAFWRGFESESGDEQEWMGRRQRKSKRSKKKKIRSCSSVYKEEGKEKQVIKPDKRKRAAKEQGAKEKMPIFSPGLHNQVAGESVTDSGIEARNGCLCRDPEHCSAERIWAFAKKIGVGDRGNNGFA
ncbi:hypothetical protein SLA2020_111360 [Shorea laevis]